MHIVRIVSRVLRHMVGGPASVRRTFPSGSLARIERAIGAAERTHGGQIRFAVEGCLEAAALFAGMTARERALEVFSQLRVWDTRHNNGVLVYLLLADRDVEIVADRGIDAQCASSVWEAICRDMEAKFRAGRFEEGVVAGIDAVAARLAAHFPCETGSPNELPDSPAVL